MQQINVNQKEQSTNHHSPNPQDIQRTSLYSQCVIRDDQKGWGQKASSPGTVSPMKGKAQKWYFKHSSDPQYGKKMSRKGSSACSVPTTLFLHDTLSTCTSDSSLITKCISHIFSMWHTKILPMNIWETNKKSCVINYVGHITGYSFVIAMYKYWRKKIYKQYKKL